MQQNNWKPIALIVAIVFLVIFGSKFYISVPVGHEAVATLFGKVVKKPYDAGLHIPVNPFYKWHLFDTRQKTLQEVASVPSQDQLQTRIDVSVQYRVMPGATPKILKETGNLKQAIDVHLIPKLRSVLREQGKTIKRAEDFFLESTQENLQRALVQNISDYIRPKGIDVQAVLIRDIQLPPFIIKAIESKKEREQAVERQRAELNRFKTEQQQKIAAAEAEKSAAEAKALQIRLLADAKAYEIEKISSAVQDAPGYLKLKALDALKDISQTPSSKIYFLNGDSPNPLPLMHIGDDVSKK